MNKPKPVLVGISGGIGAGKTLVSKIFTLLDIPVYNADEKARWLMAHQKGLKSAISSVFGEQSYFQDGSLNRKFLADKVFADPILTKKINSLVHPVVKADFREWAGKQKSRYVLKEAALLFETGSFKELEFTIHVTAPKQLRMERIKQRDPHRSETQILQIMEKQWDDPKKNELADFILYNDNSKLVIPQVLQIHKALQSGNP
ncbi:dephospho-CoA kinase [Cyclobacterium plantarum]|uniref:dephospho-CoA kinase n=1 Tax=Cyclobacterium plantarum TaxID=2716263 RepID=UPI003F6E75C6